MKTNFQGKVFHIIATLAAIAVLTPGTNSFSFELKGFGDVTYMHSTAQGSDEGKDSFALGMLDFYVSQPIDDKMDVFVELVVETNAETGEPATDLERFQIGYIVNDALKIRAGRFHNILGYWNTAYHHGAQLQTAVDRPSFLAFEDDGGVLPTHMVGLWLSGRLKTAPAAVVYGLMAGNGSRVRDGVLDPNNASDDDKSKAVSFRLRVEPSAVEGLGAGLSGNISKVTGYTAKVKDMEVMQQIYSADITYFSNKAEVIGEYYLIRDDDKFGSTGDYSSTAYYIQGGYEIMGGLIPYARYEKLDIKEEDPYLKALGKQDTESVIGGIRYNISPVSSVKGEARRIDGNGNKYEEYAVQWAVAF